MPHLRDPGQESLRDDDRRVIGELALVARRREDGEARAFDGAPSREKPIPASAIPCRLRTRPAS